MDCVRRVSSNRVRDTKDKCHRVHAFFNLQISFTVHHPFIRHHRSWIIAINVSSVRVLRWPSDEVVFDFTRPRTAWKVSGNWKLPITVRAKKPANYVLCAIAFRLCRIKPVIREWGGGGDDNDGYGVPPGPRRAHAITSHCPRETITISVFHRIRVNVSRTETGRSYANRTNPGRASFGPRQRHLLTQRVRSVQSGRSPSSGLDWTLKNKQNRRRSSRTVRKNHGGCSSASGKSMSFAYVRSFPRANIDDGSVFVPINFQKRGYGTQRDVRSERFRFSSMPTLSTTN